MIPICGKAGSKTLCCQLLAHSRAHLLTDVLTRLLSYFLSVHSQQTAVDKLYTWLSRPLAACLCMQFSTAAVHAAEEQQEAASKEARRQAVFPSLASSSTSAKPPSQNPHAGLGPLPLPLHVVSGYVQAACTVMPVMQYLKPECNVHVGILNN